MVSAPADCDFSLPPLERTGTLSAGWARYPYLHDSNQCLHRQDNQVLAGMKSASISIFFLGENILSCLN